MRIKEVMRPVKTISSDATAKEAAKKMDEGRIGSLVVVNGKKIAGIVTERDILSKVTAQNKIPSKIQISEIMTSKVITADPEDYIDDAVYLMIKHKIKKLPVMENGELVGIITSTDIIAHSDEIGQFYFFG